LLVDLKVSNLPQLLSFFAEESIIITQSEWCPKIPTEFSNEISKKQQEALEN
jgi:hypothetical protein